MTNDFLIRRIEQLGREIETAESAADMVEPSRAMAFLMEYVAEQWNLPDES